MVVKLRKRMPSMANSAGAIVDSNQSPLARNPNTSTGGSVAGWLLVLTAATVSVRLVDPTGWQGADDADYYAAAEHILAGATMERLHHHGARMAMIVPIAASVSLFGASPRTVILPTLLGSILCVLAVAMLGRLVWGWWEGIFAATVVSFLPSFRLYSTAAYPETHACLWTTLAVIVAIAAIRVQRVGVASALSVGCGLLIGLATSAKIFSVTAAVPICAILLVRKERKRPRRLSLLLSLALGMALLFLVDGLFYLWIAEDFLFKYHALASAQAADGLFSSTGGSTVTHYLSQAWNRMTLPFDPNRSTWGLVAIAFWPASVLVLLGKPPGRFIAFWAIAAYSLIALMPVRFKGGPQPYPFFDGRTVVTTCIPFSLCLGRLIRCTMDHALQWRWQRAAWPIAFAVVILASFAFPTAVEGIRHSHTKQLGRAIQCAVETTDWSTADEIFLHPSTYARFRLLFPTALQAKLRVCADEASPPWWHDATVDMAQRTRTLPPPGHAYLLATPAQLRAKPERWDYGVMLPRDILERWADLVPITQIVQCDDQTIGPISLCDSEDGKPLIYVVGGIRGPRAADRTTR